MLPPYTTQHTWKSALTSPPSAWKNFFPVKSTPTTYPVGPMQPNHFPYSANDYSQARRSHWMLQNNPTQTFYHLLNGLALVRHTTISAEKPFLIIVFDYSIYTTNITLYEGKTSITANVCDTTWNLQFRFLKLSISKNTCNNSSIS